MARQKPSVLVTGLPGIGKTTFIINLANELKHLSTAGFYTTEIREAGVRKGFDLVSLDGRKAILSHVHIKSDYRVGRYGVDVQGFEAFLDSLDLAHSDADVLLIDEIGKMECHSKIFREMIASLLDSDKPLVATIALKGEALISQIKERPDVQVIEITAANRKYLALEIANSVRSLMGKESGKKIPP
jgi:nucleoside-triphosphatase